MQSCRVTNGIQHGTETEWSKIKIAIEILRGAIVAQSAVCFQEIGYETIRVHRFYVLRQEKSTLKKIRTD